MFEKGYKKFAFSWLDSYFWKLIVFFLIFHFWRYKK